MVAASFKHGIRELLLLVAKYDGHLAIMCSEAVPWRCHRRLIADYLVMVDGISVYDIIGNSGRNSKSSQPALHKLTPFAIHHVDGAIVCPKLEVMSERK